MNTAYIQSVGGASGDMLLGALLDAGLPLDAIHAAITALNIPGVKINTADEIRCEVRGTRALVDTSESPRYSPQQMLGTVAGATTLPDSTRTRAAAVLQALFAAEARVHGNSPDDIHLHELGTADTLVDVVGVVHGLEQLGVQRIYASPLVLGEATGPRRPGGYSNPAPATLEIIAAAQAPVAPDRPFHANVGELTTPTGAALITTLADEFRQPAMTLNRIGVGVGGKNPPAFPNVIRLWLGETVPSVRPSQSNHSPGPNAAGPSDHTHATGDPDHSHASGDPDHSHASGDLEHSLASGDLEHSLASRDPEHSQLSLSPVIPASPRHSRESGNPAPPQSAFSETRRALHTAHGEPVEPPTDQIPTAAPDRNHRTDTDSPRHSRESGDPASTQSAHGEPVEPRADGDSNNASESGHISDSPTVPPVNASDAKNVSSGESAIHHQPDHGEPEPTTRHSTRSEPVEPRAASNQPPPTLETVRAAALDAYRIQADLSRHSRESGNPATAGEANVPFARWQDNVILLETNIDNATGEQLGFAMDQLFAAGALDVWHSPIQMKKNRPAILLSALAPANLETQLAEAILRHTPTLGVRVRPIGRYVADRDTVTVQTEYGPIRIKRKWLSGQIITISPEHDDLAAAVNAHTPPHQTVANAVEAESNRI